MSILTAQPAGIVPAIPVVGDKAPEFAGVSTMGEIDFPKAHFGKWTVLFSQGADLSPVCLSEMLKLASLYPEFKELNCELVGVSTNDLDSHGKWLKELQGLLEEHGLNREFPIPVISDESMEISKKYGMIRMHENGFDPLRALFIIDPDNRVRAMYVYPNENGRNFDEVLRILAAIQKTDRYNVYTPESWKPGDELLIYIPSNQRELKRIEKRDKRGAIACDENYHYCLRSSLP